MTDNAIAITMSLSTHCSDLSSIESLFVSPVIVGLVSISVDLASNKAGSTNVKA